jgi:hypothetical protein
MLEILRTVIAQHAETDRWRVSTSCSATGAHVQVDLGVGRIFRARGANADQAEENAAAKIVEWVHFRWPDPESDNGDELTAQLEASVAVAREKRGRPALRVIRGGKL